MTKPPNAKAYQRARKAIQQSREAIETLLDQTPMDDHYTLGLLGPILAELRYAQATIDQLAPQQHTA